MILDPTSFESFNQLKEIADSNYINYDNDNISKICNESKENNEDWFYLDYSKENFIESEGKGIDYDNIYIGSGKLFVCQIYNKDFDYTKSTTNNELSEFRSKLTQVHGVDSAQFYRVDNIIILEHIDVLPEKRLFRMLFPLEVPKCNKSNLFGFKIDTDTIVPEENQIILFDHAIKHSAWNLTGQDWKFLSFDILGDYIK